MNRESNSAPSTRIVPIRRERLRAAGEILTASLMDEPVYRVLFPDPVARRKALRPFLTMPARDALSFGTAYAAIAEESIVGAAVWLPPGQFPWSFTRKLRAMPALFSVLWAAPRSFPALVRLGASVEDVFPDDPVWYLEVMGVSPEAQGQGVGSRLVAPALARADKEGMPCYLETATPENIAFYERFAFRVQREVRLVPDGPPHWTMRRTPQT